MMRKRQEPDYATLVAQAERAVGGVTDPDLRRVAFEKILSTLLGHPGEKGTWDESVSSPIRVSESPGKLGKKQGPNGRIEDLIQEGFFKAPRTLADVRQELSTRGFHIPRTSLSGPLQRLCRGKRLRRQKLVANGSAKSYAYSNW
jgi:hypothetical protein